MRYWLVEASKRSGPHRAFLVEAKQVSAGVALERMRSLGRVIEVSGQTAEVGRLDLSTVRVRYDATKQPDQEGSTRYSIEGDEID